jgi:hypothetical protein
MHRQTKSHSAWRSGGAKEQRQGAPLAVCRFNRVVLYDK